MKLIKYIVVLFAVFILSGCNGATPNVYTKDYSNEKIFIRTIFVKNKYQAESIIKQLDNSNNKLQTFIELQKSYSIPLNGKATNLHTGWWADTISYQAWKGNKVFELNEGQYLTEPLQSTVTFEVVFLEKKITQREFRQLQAEHNNKTLERIAAYETDYVTEYENIVKTFPEIKTTYVQPYNKKEPCKIWFGYYETDKWFEEDSYKIAWDGSCKNGYASGLGREIETADMMDKWGIAIYKKGKPTYYIINDVLSNTLFEGINRHEQDDVYSVETIIKDKANDIEVFTMAGKRSNSNGARLIASTSPFWNGSYVYSKEYSNFQYKYTNNEQNDLNTNMDFEFTLNNRNGAHGWAIAKQKKSNIFTGEFVNKVFTPLTLPKLYNQKADAIIKEVYDAQQKAFQAQEQAQKVKKQYLKRICKDSVKVTFMDNNDYKEICSNKKELVIMQKINDKLHKISEEKIARLEKQRFNEQQQKEEQHRQEMLSVERNRLSEIQRHNMAAEAQANADHRQQGWKNLNDQINNMTPKTVNVNHMGSINMYSY